MQVDYFNILVRPTRQGSKEKLLFWAQANLFEKDVIFGSMSSTGSIILWGTVGGAIQHQIRGWMSPYRFRAERRKKFNQAYFVPDNKTIDQVVAQLEKHMTWLTLKT